MSEENKTSQITKIIVATIILALLAAVIYLYTKKNTLEKDKEVLIDTKLDLETEIKELDSKLSTMESDMQNKDLELEEKDKKVTDLEKQLKNTKLLVDKYLSEGKITKKKSDELLAQLEQKNYYIQKYQNEINQLKAENDILKGKIDTLADEISKKDSINSDLSDKNTLNQVKLQAAAILKVSDFRYYALNSRDKETEGREFKSRKVETLKVCFKVLENEIAEAGKRTFYIVISDPSGQPYKEFSSNSGFFTYRNQEIVYSSKAAIDYANDEVQVCVKYKKPDNQEFKDGVQTVKVYCEGYEIGKSTFTIK